MGIKLEITKRLEQLTNLNSIITILNLPAANYCEKRAEMVRLPDGRLEQACRGCITQELGSGERLPIQQIKEVIDFFANKYETQFITINGRGDPLHPKLKKETLGKIEYSTSKGIQSYIFTAGNNLDDETCKFLAEHKVNIMISLFGNKFLDAEFFNRKKYPSSQPPLQNQAQIAENLRRLIGAYQTSLNQPPEGTTRIGMNYVVSEQDIQDESKLRQLKAAADKNNIFLICNTNFEPNQDIKKQKQLEQLAQKYSSAHLRHSTAIGSQCQMGAGSSATVDYNGTLYRCPYMTGKGDGKFTEMPKAEIRAVLSGYIKDRDYACVIRKTPK